MAATSWRTDRCWCIAHRGGADEAPENTLAAFRHAVAVGADMVELDARASRDGEAVVAHDARLDRVTSATGPVSGRDAAELAELGVPRLADALAACAPLPVTLELKQGGALIEAVAGVVQACGRPEQVLVASFDDRALTAWRARRPGQATSLGEGEVGALIQAVRAGQTPPELPADAVAVQLPHRHGETDVVTPEVVTAAHALGLAVHVWTVNDEPGMRQLCGLGVDGVITDRPTALRALLDAGDAG